MKTVIDRGKRSKTLSKVKPVENISTNMQFSRDKSCAKVIFVTLTENSSFERNDTQGPQKYLHRQK